MEICDIQNLRSPSNFYLLPLSYSGIIACEEGKFYPHIDLLPSEVKQHILEYRCHFAQKLLLPSQQFDLEEFQIISQIITNVIKFLEFIKVHSFDAALYAQHIISTSEPLLAAFFQKVPVFSVEDLSGYSSAELFQMLNTESIAAYNDWGTIAYNDPTGIIKPFLLNFLQFDGTVVFDEEEKIIKEAVNFFLQHGQTQESLQYLCRNFSILNDDSTLNLFFLEFNSLPPQIVNVHNNFFLCLSKLTDVTDFISKIYCHPQYRNQIMSIFS